MNSTTLKYGLLVALGATSYGVLTTIVKLAYAEGFRPVEVTFAQVFIGAVGMLIISQLLVKKKYEYKSGNRDIAKLMLAGTSLGLTSIFYYLSVKYINVSVGIVLLMQSVWIGIVLEAIVDKKMPTLRAIIAVVMIIIGTLFGTNIFIQEIELVPIGIFYGLLAGLSFGITIFSTQRVASHLPSLIRSRWMLIGALIIVTVISIPQFANNFNMEIFLKWGPILALFGTIIPPILLTKGMPKITVGLGAIISSLELPVAIMMAALVLNEQITMHQFIGMFLILTAVVIANYKSV